MCGFPTLLGLAYNVESNLVFLDKPQRYQGFTFPGAGEVAQRFGVPVALEEDTSAVPRIHMVAHNQ